MNAPPPLDLRRDGIAIVFLVLVALAIQLPVYDRWVNLLDEGGIAVIADQINHGKPPYQYGVHLVFPGIFYLTAGLYRLFEPSLLVGRGFMVCVFTALVVLSYLLTRGITGRQVAFCAGLLVVAYRAWAFPHWQMLSYAPVAVLCLIATAVLLSIEMAHHRAYLPLLAGLSNGVGVLFKQDSSGIAFVVLSVFFVLTSRQTTGSWRGALRRSLPFALGACLPTALMLLAFLPMGLSQEILYQTVWVPLVAKPLWTAASAGGEYTSFPPLWPPWEATDVIRSKGFFRYLPSFFLDLYWREVLDSWPFRKTILPETFVRFIFVLPYVTLAFFIGREFWRRWNVPTQERTTPHARRLRLLIALGLAMILSFNRPRDWVHLMILYVPTLILSACLVEIAAGKARGLRRRLVLGGQAAAVGLALVASLGLVFAARGYYKSPIHGERSGIYGKQHVAAVLNPLVAQLMPAPGTEPAPLAALPAYPALNFLTARPLATRFLTLLPLEEFPDRDEQILASFESDPRTEFVYSLQRAAVFERPQDYAPGVFSALVADHELGVGPGNLFNGTGGDGLIIARLVPRDDPPETILYDFAANLDTASLSILEGDALDEAARDRASVASLDTWPFERPVLAQTPPLPPLRRELVYHIDIPESARLRFGVAMNPDTWTNFLTFALTFTLRVDGEVAFEQWLDPRRDFDDRKWVWADLPLAAGPHTVGFETRADNAFGAVATVAGWARPRLVLERSD